MNLCAVNLMAIVIHAIVGHVKDIVFCMTKRSEKMLDFEDIIFGICTQAINVILPLFVVKTIFSQLREQYFRA